MCGLVGVVVKQSNGFLRKQEDTFYQMLYADVLRGEDSTGIIAVENTGGFHIAKEATEATWLIPQIKKGPIGTAMFNKGAALVGHNRKATVGTISDETAHPFVVDGTFAMVHNGTLYNHKQLANTDVDSEALAKVLKVAFEDDNPKEKLEETLGKVFGAYAIIAFDQKTHKVHFLRNKDRPLAYVETEDGWLFASEMYMLGWIASRNGYDLSKHKLQSLKEHELMSINLETNEVAVEQLVPKKATPNTSNRRATHTGVGEVTKITGAKSISDNNSTFLEGGVLSKNEFKRLRKKYIYTRQEFWALDYIEKNFPATIEQGEKDLLVMGESDDLNYECIIHAVVNLDELGISAEEAPQYFNERKWVGVVQEMSYDRASGMITFHLSKAKPIGQPTFRDIHEDSPTVH